MEKRKVVILIVVIALLLGVGYGIYQYTKPPVNRAEVAASETVQAAELFQVMSSNDTIEQQRFLNQVIRISGVVQESSETSIFLAPGIVCRLESAAEGVEVNNEEDITIKGRVTGYDDLLNEVSVDYAVIE